MSSQPASPAELTASSQQQQSEGNRPQPSSSPHSRADSAVHVDVDDTHADPDSSFQSNASERHPKGKRKRTAAKDKAILEAAYNANPKPDKAARLDIVRRVSLNEKEVQIWFQNRRQNDRRKSRPLSPQEIAALQYGAMQVMSSSAESAPGPGPYSTNSAPPPHPSSNRPPAAQDTSPGLPSSSGPEMRRRDDVSPISPTAQSEGREENFTAVEQAEARDLRRESLASVGIPFGPSSQPVEFTASGPPQLYRSHSVGYFANRLHAGTAFQSSRRSPDSYRQVPEHLVLFLFRDAAEAVLTMHRHEFMPAPRPSSAAPGTVLPAPQSSKFRLSMSVEGKAELVSQPSPSRLSPSALSDHSSSVPPDRPHLDRSQSHGAAGFVTLPPISTLTASLEADALPPHPPHVGLQQPQPRFPPRLHRSRSRDVHAWELACEANSGELRDELTAYAERESSGSAIAAISLLRTLSSTSHVASSPISHAHPHPGHVLQSNSAKRNARPSVHPHPPHNAKKPKLGRASSSVARLQTDFVHASADKPSVRQYSVDVDHDDPKKVKMSLLLSPGGNDSDKENWSPGDDGQGVFRGSQRAVPASGRRPLPSAAPGQTQPQHLRRRALEDGTNRFMLGRASTAPAAKRKKGEQQLPIEIFEDDGRHDADADADALDDEDHHHCHQYQPQARPAPRSTDDDEVERFMRGEVSPSKKGAASAIAGLLALSQGNWR